jgi:high-affinity iron transporter
MLDLTAALPTFVVTLREGFEAALVVGIVFACLDKAQQPQLKRWVYQGIGGGIVASFMLGLLLGGVFEGVNASTSPYTPVVKEILATLFGLIAVLMLSWMLLWMTKQARSLKGEIEGNIQTALQQESTAKKQIFLLVFIAVVREGFETVLFISAQFQDSWLAPTLGAIAGLSSAALLGFLLFKGGVKLNIRRFFQIMGIFLLLIVAGLLVSVLKHLDATLSLLGTLDPALQSWCVIPGESCLLGNKFWDLSQILPDKQFPGILLKALFGYRQVLYWGQAIAYVVFLGVVGSKYWLSLNQPKAEGDLAAKKPGNAVN